MKLNKIIFLSDFVFIEGIKENYELKEKEKNSSFEIYEKNDNEEETTIIVYFIDFKKAFEFIKENYYEIFKIVLVGFAKKLGNTQLIEGDIVFPNTFISNNSKNPIFLEYAIGEDYDLNIFGLILNGICLTGTKIDELDFNADIIDNEIYDFLSLISKNPELLEKVVVLKGVLEEDKKLVSGNLTKILDLVI